MYGLTKCFNDEEKQAIADELDKLFKLQDRALQADKKVFFVDELVASPYNLPQIVTGLRSLYDTDLDNIKFARIIKAIEDNIEREKQPEKKFNKSCPFCSDIGFALMIDDDAYEYAFACKCDNGKQRVKHAAWDGKSVQVWQGKKYTYKWSEMFKQ